MLRALVASVVLLLMASPAVADDIDGTPGDDRVGGTESTDLIHTFGGDDRVWSHDGDDVVVTGGGRDRVRGGDGDDVIRLGDSPDDYELRDIGIGGPGDDRIFGMGGSDSMDGQLGTNLLVGGSGADHVTSRGTDDRVFAGRGNDSVLGAGGVVKQLDLGPGNDYAALGWGPLNVDCGPGEDEVVVESNPDPRDHVVDCESVRYVPV